MALEEGPGSSTSKATAGATCPSRDSVEWQPDDGVGHLIEPLNFLTAAKSAGGGGSTSAADRVKGTTFISRLSEQFSAVAALLRPQTSSEIEPQESPSAGSALLPIQQKAHPLKYLTLAAGLLTCIWGWRSARSIERVVERRYADIAYQIRRPDALSARISAFKFLVLGGLALPGSAVAFASLRVEAPRRADQAGDSTEAAEAKEVPSNDFVPRRAVLAEILPVTLQADVRRLVAAFHGGLSDFVEAVAPSREKWEHWAAGARTSHVAGLQRPSALSSRVATWKSSDESGRII